jgi:hypothetical protein
MSWANFLKDLTCGFTYPEALPSTWESPELEAEPAARLSHFAFWPFGECPLSPHASRQLPWAQVGGLVALYPRDCLGREL